MSELVTIARPYAKAVFDFAIENQSVEHWQNMLAFASKVACNKDMIEFLSGMLAPKTLFAFFNTVCAEQLDEYAQNLIKVMAENKRLKALPVVLEQFIQLRDIYENISRIDVISANVLSERQLKKISIAMEKYLLKKIKLNCKIDKSVIAGVILRTGDLVIDGSVRGRLNRLADVLI